jgi:hypothetical protein
MLQKESDKCFKMNFYFLGEETFRSNPVCELVEFGNLQLSDREALLGLVNDPELFGIFKVNTPGFLPVCKVAYKEVALLFYYLQEPRKLPFYIKNTFDDDINATIAKLVVENILEIKSKDFWLSGIAAQGLLFKEKIFAKIPQQQLLPIAYLSAKAIEYVLQLNFLDTRTIASRLYCYNTIPVSKQNSEIPDSAKKTQEFLGIYTNHSLRDNLLKYWYKHTLSNEFHWHMWSRKDKISRGLYKNAVYKLYISPAPALFPGVFAKSVEILSMTAALGFKTGIDRHGLLRPDKFMVYFHHYDQLMDAAAILEKELKGFKSQGVPFTAQLDDNGMLSWGVDPPKSAGTENLAGGSWRGHITEQIAMAVIRVKELQLPHQSAIEYIMNKISLDWVDPLTWCPLKHPDLN